VRTHLLQRKAEAAAFTGMWNAAETASEGEGECARQLEKIRRPFDVLILGMGGDGHTASLFPGAVKLAQATDMNSGKICMGIAPVTAPHERMTLTLPAILDSKQIFLHITGQRADGYHELQTVFQLLDHGDRLAFEVTDNAAIERVTDVTGIPANDDLVVKAAKLLQRHLGIQQGAKIYLDKQLPMGGGLGGGSSDAATTLIALNKIWGGNLSESQLIELGVQLGADIPVFIKGETAWAEGVGDRLEAVLLPRRCYLVVNPGVHVSTAELFSATQLTRDCRTITIRAFLDGTTRNVFEPLVKQRYPKVRSALNWLGQFADAKLTGTGSQLLYQCGPFVQKYVDGLGSNCERINTGNIDTIWP